MHFLARAVVAAVLVLGFSSPGLAQQDTPQATIEKLNAALLDVMQNAQSLGYEGRYERLAPVLTEVYNFPIMAQISVGRSSWNDFDETQRQQFVQSFSDMSIATYAARFDGYSGERFEIVGNEEGPRGSILVRSRLVRPNDQPVALNYVLRDFGGQWRVLDVLLEGNYSEMSRQRAEFTSVLRREGFDGLLREIRDTTRRLASEA